jgi:hypothetical protein
VDAHQRSFAFKFIVGHRQLLEPIRQPNSCNREKQSDNHACCHIRCGREPFAVFQHLGRFPSEAGKRGVAAEKPHGNGHPPVWRDDHAVQRELTDQSEQKATREIDQQRAVRKSATSTCVDEALQSVTCQCAYGSENCDQCQSQVRSNPTQRRRQATSPASLVGAQHCCARVRQPTEHGMQRGSSFATRAEAKTKNSWRRAATRSH